MTVRFAAIAVLAACCPAPAPPPPPSPPTRLPGGEPILRLPFAAGTAVFCQQGNRSGGTRSHNYPNAFHALDLGTLTPGTAVVAAAEGTVLRIVTGAAPGVALPGGGFGNQVVIDHGEGYTTLYAHLAEVGVAAGQRIRAGDKLGVMGETGQAGNPHLHFSLHRSEWPPAGAPETVAMHALIAADISQYDISTPADFRLLTSLEIVCAAAEISPAGHVYGSENAPGTPPRVGAAPEIAGALALSAAGLREQVQAALGAEAIVQGLDREGSAATRARLEAFLRGHPDDPQALYWIAVISLRDLGDAARAEEALARLAPIAPAGLAGWVLVRRAELAEKQGRLDDARALWKQAAERKDDDPQYRDFIARAKTRLGL